MSSPLEPTRYPAIKRYTTGAGVRYLVRYRLPDGKQSMKRGFTRIGDAKAWLSEREEADRRGVSVKVSAGRTTVSELWPAWHAAKKMTNTPSSLSALESSWRTHVEPRWGHIPVAKVRTGDVQEWAASITAAKRNTGQPASASVIRRAVGILDGLLATAVRDGRIPLNPASSDLLELPTKPRYGKTGEARRYLSVDEVKRLAVAVDADREIVVWLAAVCGLRYSEVNGLQAEDIDVQARRLRIDRAWTQDNHGTWHLGAPKHGKRRTVRIPVFILPMLEQQLVGKQRGDRLIRRRDGSNLPLPYLGKAKGWREANWLERGLAAADLGWLTPHDLRHTAASLAVQAGANVKALSRMLGHADTSETLNVYADLFDSDLDDVARALDSAFA